MKVSHGLTLGTAISLASTASAWVSQSPRALSTASRTSQVYNIPPPSEESVAEFTEYSSKLSPPSSFFELQQDCIRSTRLALQDGHKLLEVEFPPLPANVLEMDDVSAYEVAEANINLSIEYAKGLLAAVKDGDLDLKKIAILMPDEAELAFAVERVGTSDPYPGITISSLRKSDPDDTRVVKPEQLLLSLFGNREGIIKPIEGADMYICLVASAQELPDIEELTSADPGKPVVMYNLKLDILRGDLGAPAFPKKEFHDRFLSRVKPVYYLRTRQYSRSTPNPPFLVNYQGCLFRAYPGEYQTLLDTGTGRYRRLLGNKIRPSLGTFKEQLTDELKRQGIVQDEGSAFEWLRTGYKTTTWWEEEREEANDAWVT